MFDVATDVPVLRPVSASSGRSSVSSSRELAGTSWQLVTFQGGDDTRLTPDDRAKYTIQFAAAGRFFTRVDCNRGQGTWKSSGLNQIEFGPLALTRAQCPPGSLHDQIVNQWGNIRSYVIRDGHPMRRAVRLGRSEGDSVEVLAGLAEGDQVALFSGS